MNDIVNETPTVIGWSLAKLPSTIKADQTKDYLVANVQVGNESKAFYIPFSNLGKQLLTNLEKPCTLAELPFVKNAFIFSEE